MPLVVAAAIVAGDPPRLLAAQRSGPPALAGRWELLGGKVEPGEEERDALVREVREEIGMAVRVGDRVGEDLPIGEGYGVLRVYAATPLPGPVPHPFEHRALRWLAAGHVGDVDWLDSNLPLLSTLEALLSGSWRRAG